VSTKEKPAGLVADPRKIDPELRKKYDVRGPRYTSYPPATHFDSIDSRQLFERWRARNQLKDDPGLSLYCHIPFCRKRCLFCGCHTYAAKQTSVVDAYLESLISEMQLAAKQVSATRPVHQVALGGGTPNFLSQQQLERLLAAIQSIWQIADAAELSAEINPRTSTAEKLDAFIKHGFNRFSLGIQDFSRTVLETIKRDQGLMEVDQVIGYLRQNEIKSINFDLIYGLPGQSLASCRETIEQVIELKPTRIALYSYAHVPWIHAHQKALERAGLPEPDLKAALFLSMAERLVESGYQFIGMDHFALPDDPLAVALAEGKLRRNFMGYTTGRGLDLLAFGASAISSIGSAYSQNDKKLGGYQSQLADNSLPIVRGFLLDRDDLIRRELLMEMFCNFQVDFKSLARQFDIEPTDYFASDLENLAPLVADQLVNWTSDGISVSDSGRFFIRNICMVFDRHLEKDGSQRVYSRTI
jgi:oxygen-independent coproporphyrinogen III oxidase